MRPFCILLSISLICTPFGCASFQKKNQTQNFGETTWADEFPELANAPWHCHGRAKLNASPQTVFDEIVNPITGVQTGVKVSIDHSASQSGPDRWGVGSTVHVSDEKLVYESTICKYEPPHLIVHRTAHSNPKRSVQLTHISELQTAPDGGTILTLRGYGDPDDDPWISWPYQRNFRHIVERDLGKLVAQFGGEVIEVSN
jgi:hypothetical protein